MINKSSLFYPLIFLKSDYKLYYYYLIKKRTNILRFLSFQKLNRKRKRNNQKDRYPSKISKNKKITYNIERNLFPLSITTSTLILSRSTKKKNDPGRNFDFPRGRFSIKSGTINSLRRDVSPPILLHPFLSPLGLEDPRKIGSWTIMPWCDATANATCPPLDFDTLCRCCDPPINEKIITRSGKHGEDSDQLLSRVGEGGWKAAQSGPRLLFPDPCNRSCGFSKTAAGF